MEMTHTLRRLFTIFFVVGLLGACSQQLHDFKEVHALNEVQPVGSPFTQRLTTEYRDFVNNEIDIMHDHADGIHFARKGLASARGLVVLPEPISDWNLLPVHMQELGNARARLIRVFEYGAREINPGLSAVAQARFDCWIEQQEEKWQTDDIAACRNEFMSALNQLEATVQPVVAPAPPPPAPVAQPFDVDPSQPMKPENSMYLVFFDFDKHNINQGASSVLDAVSREVNGRSVSVVNVVGHADTVGSYEYNRSLAMKRANAIRSDLVQRGVNPNLIRVESRGEEDLMVPTPDNVREPANRRGEISFE